FPRRLLQAHDLCQLAFVDLERHILAVIELFETRILARLERFGDPGCTPVVEARQLLLDRGGDEAQRWLSEEETDYQSQGEAGQGTKEVKAQDLNMVAERHARFGKQVVGIVVINGSWHAIIPAKALGIQRSSLQFLTECRSPTAEN